MEILRRYQLGTKTVISSYQDKLYGKDKVGFIIRVFHKESYDETDSAVAASTKFLYHSEKIMSKSH